MSGSSAPSAVVDTNVFVSGMLNPAGPPSRLLDSWYAGRFELLLSDRQNSELRDVFSRPKLSQATQLQAARLLQMFRALDFATTIVLRPSNPIAVRDPKDEHILAAALGGNADYLVTGDADLLVLQGNPRLGKLEIVTSARFLTILEQSTRTET